MRGKLKYLRRNSQRIKSYQVHVEHTVCRRTTAMRHRLSGVSIYGLNDLRDEDETPLCLGGAGHILPHLM